MRKWIDLMESVVTLYHGSRLRFPQGTVLKAQPDGYVSGSSMDDFERASHDKCEAIMEAHRPSGAPHRAQSVYLVDDIDMIDNAGGYTDHIYIVDPHGTPWKANLSWYSELYLLCEDDQDHPEEAAELAQKYWAAAPKDESDCYEYLVLTAEVIREI